MKKTKVAAMSDVPALSKTLKALKYVIQGNLKIKISSWPQLFLRNLEIMVTCFRTTALLLNTGQSL